MNKKSNFFIFLGSACLLAAGLLFGHHVWTDHHAKSTAARTVCEVRQEVAKTEPIVPQNLDVWEINLPEYCLNPEMEMPTCVVDGQTYIGVMSIPALELELPVISEWSYPNLKCAPCRYEGSAYQGNMVVAAHNYLSHFGRLNQLTPGATVSFTDMDGNEFQYQVSEFQILNPTDVAELTAGTWDLTLFTCTVGGNTRLVVRCTAI